MHFKKISFIKFKLCIEDETVFLYCRCQCLLTKKSYMNCEPYGSKKGLRVISVIIFL